LRQGPPPISFFAKELCGIDANRVECFRRRQRPGKDGKDVSRKILSILRYINLRFSICPGISVEELLWADHDRAIPKKRVLDARHIAAFERP